MSQDSAPQQVLVLDHAALAAWASRWNDLGIWPDIEWLATRVWRAAPGDELRIAWHHLLLSVGNFKRQGGRRIQPSRLNPGASIEFQRPNEVVTPTGLTVGVDTVKTWKSLQAEIPGIAAPTCTTLLAALWPGKHFIFDWRVRAVASALLISQKLPPCPSIKAHSNRALGPVTLVDYDHARHHLMASGVDLRQAERALYQVSRHIPPEAGRTWDSYSHRVAALLRDGPEPAQVGKRHEAGG